MLTIANANPDMFILLKRSLKIRIPKTLENSTTKTLVMANAMLLSKPGLAKKLSKNTKE